jgi:hypothetical protein
VPEVSRLHQVHQKRGRRGVDVAVWRRRKEVGDVAALALQEVAVGCGVAGGPFGGSSEHAESTVGACACSQMSGEAARWAAVPCLRWPRCGIGLVRHSFNFSLALRESCGPPSLDLMDGAGAAMLVLPHVPSPVSRRTCLRLPPWSIEPRQCCDSPRDNGRPSAPAALPGEHGAHRCWQDRCPPCLCEHMPTPRRPRASPSRQCDRSIVPSSYPAR